MNWKFWKKKPTKSKEYLLERFTFSPPFEGFAMLKIPNITERFRILSIIAPKGVVDMAGLSKFYEEMDRYVAEFNVKIGKKKIFSLSELSFYEAGNKSLTQITELIIKGVPLEVAPVISLHKK